MAWLVEDGRVITGSLAPFYDPHELRAGMRVRIWKSNKRLADAIIERAHACWHDYVPHAQDMPPNGLRWEQTRVHRDGSHDHIWTQTGDDQPVTKECETFGSADRPGFCVHVRYRNNKREVGVHPCYVRPPNAIDALAQLAPKVKP